MTLHGETVTVATLDASQVCPIQKKEIAHARLLKASQINRAVTGWLCQYCGERVLEENATLDLFGHLHTILTI